MNDTIRNEIEKAVNENRYTLLDYKRYSKHRDDKYLFTVLAKIEQGIYGTQYVTWLYNSSTEALNIGHYYDCKDAAYEDYRNRGWKP